MFDNIFNIMKSFSIHESSEFQTSFTVIVMEFVTCQVLHPR